METGNFETSLSDLLEGKTPKDPSPEQILKHLRKAERDFRKALREAMGTLMRHLEGFKEWSNPDGEFLWYTDDRYSTYITLKHRPIPERMNQIDIDVTIQPNSGADVVLYSRAYSLHSRNWNDAVEIAEGLTLGVASFYVNAPKGQSS